MDAVHTESVCVNQVMMTHWCCIYLRKQKSQKSHSEFRLLWAPVHLQPRVGLGLVPLGACLTAGDWPKLSWHKGGGGGVEVGGAKQRTSVGTSCSRPVTRYCDELPLQQLTVCMMWSADAGGGQIVADPTLSDVYGCGSAGFSGNTHITPPQRSHTVVLFQSRQGGGAFSFQLNS